MAGITLSRIFKPPAQLPNRTDEVRFRRDYAMRYRESRRAALVLGVLLWLGFTTTDVYYYNLYPSRESDLVLQQVLLYRLVGALILTTGLVLSWRPSFQSEERMTALLCVGMVLLYGINLLMIFSVPYPRHYQNGLLLVLFFVFGFFRIRSKPLGLVLGAMFLISAPAYLNNVSLDAEATYWRSSFFNLVAFCLLGWGIAIALERSAREAFSQQLEVEKARSAAELRARALSDSQNDLHRELSKLKQEKTEFLAKAVHDLRNQAHAIGCDVALAKDGAENPEVVAAYLGRVEQSTERLSASFHALLDLARLESGAVRFNLKEIDLVPLVRETVEALGDRATEADIRLGMFCRSQAPLIVRTDRDQLSRVLCNLISNAIKYADPTKGASTFVSVGVVRLAGRVRIDVVDNGIGIPQHDMLRIFDPFEQLFHRRDGVGLGLSIVREIVNQLEQHQIGLSSTLGRGTRFRIDLPLIERPDAEHEEHEPGRAEGRQATLDNAYVLLIEDDRVALTALAAVIRARGAIVDEAASQRQALDILDSMERDFDLILTDYRLDGGTTATAVIQHAREAIAKTLPIIVLTGEIEIARDDAGLAGILLLSKPIPPTALVSQAANLLAGRCRG